VDRNLLIEIFVPRTGGGGNIATGYPVAKNRILTARHALFPPNRDTMKPIEVRWRHQSGEAREWRGINAIAWDGGDAFDVALIDCEFPSECSTWGVLTEAKPKDHMRWASEGFAAAGRRDEASREPIPMLGLVSGAANTQTEFWLGANYEVSLHSSWAGSSGSPVFVHGKIIGVIVSCPPNFDQRRLRATPAWKLLADPAFRAAIGYDDRQRRLDKVQREIAKELSSSPETMDALRDVDVAPHKERVDRARTLAQTLVDLRVEDAVKVLREADQDPQETDPPRSNVVLKRVAQWVIPTVFDPGMIKWLQERRTDLAAAFVSLPAATRTVAEIIMAGMDVRRTSIPPRSKDKLWPEGPFGLPMPPESGVGNQGQAFKEAFDTHLIAAFTDSTMRAERNREALIKYVANELEYRAEQEAETWYFIYSPPSNVPEISGIDAAIEELKKQYQSIVFIRLRQDDDLFLSETRLLRPVRDLLSDEDEGDDGD
jgi:hypothetical protein